MAVAGWRWTCPSGTWSSVSATSRPPLADPHQAVWDQLARPSGTRPLAELARGRQSACVAICDVTRPVPNRSLLPPILQTLEKSGRPRDRILVLVATGLHRPNLGDELVEMVGPAIVDEYRIENHDGRALSEHAYLGDTPRGVPVWIDRRYVEADLKITTGLIEPHFMAGFSGGRKLICPGLAAWETISAGTRPHFSNIPTPALASWKETRCTRKTPGSDAAGCDFIVNTVLDAKRQILALVAGDMEQAFHEGVDFVGRLLTDTVAEPVDIVVTTAAGYPLDTTFYQSVKGMVGAMEIVKPGGTIILAASLTEGIGSPEFQRLFEDNPSLDVFMDRILHNGDCTLDQWQLEEMAKVRRKADIKVVTHGLPPETVNRLFVEALRASRRPWPTA